MRGGVNVYPLLYKLCSAYVDDKYVYTNATICTLFFDAARILHQHDVHYYNAG